MKESWYNIQTAKSKNTSPEVLKMMLEIGENDAVSQHAVFNSNCPPEALKMVLERGRDDSVSVIAARNPNCPPESLKMVLERGRNDSVSVLAVQNPNCPSEALKTVLKRGEDDAVSNYAVRNQNCPPEAKIRWMIATGKISKEDPNNPNHRIEYNEKPKDNSALEEFRKLVSKSNNWYKTSQEKRWIYQVEGDGIKFGVSYLTMTESEAIDLKKSHPNWKIKKYMAAIEKESPKVEQKLPEDPVEAFIEDVSRDGSVSPLNSRVIVIGGKFSISLSRHVSDERGVYVSDMFSFDPGHGIGSSILEMLKGKAREHGVNLYLLPKVMDGASISQKDLENWYSRHGFKFIGRGVMKYDGAPLQLTGKYREISLE